MPIANGAFMCAAAPRSEIVGDRRERRLPLLASSSSIGSNKLPRRNAKTGLRLLPVRRATRSVVGVRLREKPGVGNARAESGKVVLTAN